MYQVQKGVELTNPRRGRKRIYPFQQMEVGDSFVVEIQNRARVVSAASSCKEMKFATRVVVEDGKKVCRVWRVE